VFDPDVLWLRRPKIETRVVRSEIHGRPIEIQQGGIETRGRGSDTRVQETETRASTSETHHPASETHGSRSEMDCLEDPKATRKQLGGVGGS
jgi:hypothetical protein